MKRFSLLALFLLAGCTKPFAMKDAPARATLGTATPFSTDCKNTAAPADVKATVAAVKEALGVTDCDAAAALLPQQTSLDLSNRGLTNLSPLRGLRVRRLFLDNARLSDLGQIAPLCPTLELLSVRENLLTTLEPLRGCTALQMLYVDGNNIPSLEPLTALPLKVLSADRNRLDTVAPLAAMTSLKFLSLLHNPIATLAPIVSLVAGLQAFFPPPGMPLD